MDIIDKLQEYQHEDSEKAYGKPKSFVRRFLESTRILERSQSLTKVYEQYDYYQGEQPEISFRDSIYYFERTPQLQHPVMGYTDLVFGTDLQVNADDEKAKKLIEDWNNKTKFYNKIRAIGTTNFICGAALLEKIGRYDDMKPVDMRTISGKQRDPYGITTAYKHHTQEGQIVDLDPKNYIEFDLTDYSELAWGRSLFYSLIVPRQLASNGQVMRPVIEVLWSMEQSMDGIMQNHASPEKFITYEGASDVFLKKQEEKFKKRRPGAIWLGGRKPDLDIVEAQGNSKFEYYIQHIEKTFELGTQFPHDIMTGDFTSRASSETTESLLDKRVRGYQRYIINKILDEIYKPLLILNGIDPVKANLSISFETGNLINLTIENMVDMYIKKGITVNEFREWVKDRTGIDLFEDKEIQDIIQQKQDMAQQKMDSLTTDDKKADEMRKRQKEILEMEATKHKLEAYKKLNEELESDIQSIRKPRKKQTKSSSN